MTGPERDLAVMLATLSVVRRPGRFAYLDQAEVPAGAVVHATVVEPEGTSAVIELAPNGEAGPVPEFVAAWLTVEVHSALDAVGLTAALSGALADAGIACNVLAGRLHDHLLVPEGQADRALDVLDGLRDGHRRGQASTSTDPEGRAVGSTGPRRRSESGPPSPAG